MNTLSGIYAISDEILSPYDTLYDQLSMAISGGISCFQLRDKTNTDKFLKTWCIKLEELCRNSDVTFILNDRVELAIAIKAQGLHIGSKNDGSLYSLDEIRCIRDKFDGVFGISCYGNISFAKQVKNIGVDYVAFGSCFVSPTKRNAKQIDISIFDQIHNIPKCAIGGIDDKNVGLLKNANMIASISYIWNGDIADNVRKLKSAWLS